ncbi:hypothetical protein BCY89_19220 [Sphingobacterium siyangense]|uniref:Uncharacterized protein n=1 Tax=Sphingobacterium siyangense TaxID=459529 RepID=A0A420FDL4_9SPHI|nr:hypothetical protein BCY89_19220 [Sphingobacterium siyangense]
MEKLIFQILDTSLLNHYLNQCFQDLQFFDVLSYPSNENNRWHHHLRFQNVQCLLFLILFFFIQINTNIISSTAYH